MKKIILFLMFSCMLLLMYAQQKPHYTQYILNNYILNPAVTGIENYTDVKLSYRSQWSGLPGAPQTAYFSIHGPIGKQDDGTTATSFSIPGENPRGRSYWEQYNVPPPHHGIGAVVMNDRTGFINRFSAFASYAYHLGISPRTSIAAGFSGGFSSLTLDRSKIDWASLDPNDPAIGVASGELRKWRPELAAGIWIYSSDFVGGISVQNIIPSKVSFTNDDKYGEYYKPHFFATLGYRFLLNDDINCLPSITAKYVTPLSPQYDFNCKLQYRDQFWLGASWRSSEVFGGWSAMAGLHLANTFNISYAYDVNTNVRMKGVTGGSHELIVGFILGNSYGDTCPRNVW